MNKIKLVIIGNGMVGHRFVQELIDKAGSQPFAITIFCAEPRVAYDRVHLSSYFSDKTADELSLVTPDFYSTNNIVIHLNESIIRIDRANKIVYSQTGQAINYDKLILATGSYPWIPSIKGADGENCYVYRTLEDLDAIAECAKRSQRGAVVGGGLLGLEAAGALKNLGIEAHVVEFAPVLMAEQLDTLGGEQLRKKIEGMGVVVHTSKNTQEIIHHAQGKTMQFADGSSLDIDFIVFSTGIRAQDQLARDCQLSIGPRGGIVINNYCQTNDPDIYAIGECACWQNHVYGLVAPGYKMAQVAVSHLLNESNSFTGADMSAKLKLLGVDVGSIGDARGRTSGSRSYLYLDENKQVYKRLIVSQDNRKLLGAVLVGDTSDYGNLLQMMLNGIDLPDNPDSLILPDHAGSKPVMGVDSLPDSAQICSCFDISKGQIIEAIHAGCHTLDQIKATTKAGTGCGGCLPLVSQLLNAELSKQGIEVNNHLCEHFAFSRQELYHLVRVEGIKSFEALIRQHGKGYGCEICKPVVGSILASCWNEYVLKPELVPLQDTNDLYLGNIQKDGTYSIIPRSSGGEITPEALIAIGKIARKYQLYSRVTISQRIGLFGAYKSDLPAIWKELIAAGFETGHAYAKALRMAKTCVGNTWCRYGVGDSTSFGIEIENRYKGIRAPHKIKIGVSGCARECAEAHSKDIGLIATEKGWNLYVGGNGSITPRHADLFASDLNHDTVLTYLDRFLIFYIRTADKLQRTSRWIENLDGGIDYLRSVIIDDKLGINAELEAEMTRLRKLVVCEWKTTIESPEAQQRFTHFINSTERDKHIKMVPERNQHRPAKPEERCIITIK
ncbi:MAG: nitrite reductase large subunit [Candidatus Schmidhempelia sp.]|nr:nitrite reductase large subunit [Candidatus Schmidhempelia sp.]